MKISCILASFNRPILVRQSIKSVACQTHKDYELLIVDESDAFDIHEAVADFALTAVDVEHLEVSRDERKTVNRLSVNINRAARKVSGDLVCYLADDDYYWPEWFAEASAFFEKNRDAVCAFGRLTYTKGMEMVFDQKAKTRFPSKPLRDPYCILDHNQFMHRRFDPPIPWSEDLHTVSAPDGLFMRELGKRHTFLPIPAFAAVKRMHGKNIQDFVQSYRDGTLKGLRE